MAWQIHRMFTTANVAGVLYNVYKPYAGHEANKMCFDGFTMLSRRHILQITN